MADIELVIKIPENIWVAIQNGEYCGILDDRTYNAIKNGTPLPKGHGDLIDRSNIYKAIYAEEDNLTGMGMTLEEMDEYNNGINAMYALVRGAKPIIEADKAESEDKNETDN